MIQPSRFVPALQNFASAYVGIPLDALDPSATNTNSCRAINGNTLVVGQSKRQGGAAVACRWLAGSPFDLGDFGGDASDAYGINDSNIICGSARLVSGLDQAAIWQNGLVRNLGSLSGSGGRSMALALTDGVDPLVFGYSEMPGGSNRAVQWVQLGIQRLEFKGEWDRSAAQVVSYNNWPAGSANWPAEQRQICVLWEPGNAREVRGLASAIAPEVKAGHPNGYLVGYSDDGPSTESRAVVFDAVQPGVYAREILGPGAALRSYAFGVNVHGMVVGTYETATGSEGFIHSIQDGGIMENLTNRLDSQSLVDSVSGAVAIQEDGIILAKGLAGGVPVMALLWPL